MEETKISIEIVLISSVKGPGGMPPTFVYTLEKLRSMGFKVLAVGAPGPTVLEIMND